MLALDLPSVSRLTVLGAHPDDIEIAAGGTLLLLAASNPGIRVHYVVLTGSPERQAEARQAAEAFLPDARLSIAMHDLPDGRLPSVWAAVKQAAEAAARTGPADLVLAPSPDDAHQDHRTLAEVVPTAFRDSLTLHYEIPKWDGDLGRRNVYVPIDEPLARRKVELLNRCFPSQKARDWWADEVFLGLARLRGVEIRARYAEAFTSYKTALRPGGGGSDGAGC